jgi:hypothetical protein
VKGDFVDAATTPAAQLRRARPNPLNGLTVKPRKAFTDARGAGPHRLGETRLCRAVSAQHNSKLLGEMMTLHRFKDLPAPTHHEHERSVALNPNSPLGRSPNCGYAVSSLTDVIRLSQGVVTQRDRTR